MVINNLSETPWYSLVSNLWRGLNLSHLAVAHGDVVDAAAALAARGAQQSGRVAAATAAAIARQGLLADTHRGAVIRLPAL